jgi:Xaa-Pro aminopeptidase
MDRTAQRRERIRRTFQTRTDRVDGLLVVAECNVRYLTGFTGDSAALILTRDRAIVISDGRYLTQLEQECPELQRHIRPVGQQLIAGIAEVLAKLGLKRLGFEAESLPAAGYLALKEAPGLSGTELKPLSGRVEALRAIKDREEIAAIRAAVDIAERAFVMLLAGWRRDENEKDLADMLEGYLRRCGATGASFPPIVAAGPRSALPHARPLPEVPIGPADFVLVDWGATGQPYKSDLTRVVVTGKVTPKFEKVYRTVLAAQQRGIAAIRPGVLARDVDAEARAVVEEAGFGRFFRHGLGHGLGLEIHEAPRLHRDSDIRLEPGMIVTVEPGIYLPEWGGVRIEDDVLVTPEGCEVLSHVAKSLDAVRSWSWSGQSSGV